MGFTFSAENENVTEVEGLFSIETETETKIFWHFAVKRGRA